MSADFHRQNTMNITTIPDTGVVAVVRETTMEIGTPRATGMVAFVRRTYPAVYNHVVRNMNAIGYQTNTKNKSSMRGGHFLLYRYVVLLAILLCFCFGIASLYVKPLAVVPFILSTLYITLSIYNIVIYIRNRPLLHPILTREVHAGAISGGYQNEFYSVPVNATVLTGVLAAFIDPAVIAAAVHKENIQLTEIKIMLYNYQYKRDSRLPREIVVHLILFFILFILAIAFVSTVIN